MNPNELFDKNTHNSDAKNRRFCWIKRPCFRIHECTYCWNRRRKYFIEQLKYLGIIWDLKQFITIHFCNSETFSAESCLAELSKIRSYLHPKLFKCHKYISCIAVVGVHSKFSPHIHILCSSLNTKDSIMKALKKCPNSLGDFDINIRAIYGPKRLSLARLGGYLMDQNFRKSIPWLYPRCRLLTATRGFKTGRPTKRHNLYLMHEDFPCDF